MQSIIKSPVEIRPQQVWVKRMVIFTAIFFTRKKDIEQPTMFCPFKHTNTSIYIIMTIKVCWQALQGVMKLQNCQEQCSKCQILDTELPASIQELWIKEIFSSMKKNNHKPNTHSLQQNLINVNNNYCLINYFISLIYQPSNTIFSIFCQFSTKLAIISVNFCISK